jgi:hypothetical protein
VVAAPDAIIFDASEFERSAAMGTVELQQSKLSATVTEKDKVFAEEPHFDRRTF